MKTIKLISLLFICFVSRSYAEPNEVVSWPQANFPPYAFFLDTKLQVKGIHQRITSYIIDELKGRTKNIFYKANYERIVHEISSKKPVVMVGILITKERLKKGLLYSEIPMNILYPNRIIIKKSNFRKFKKFMVGEYLNLEKALSSHSISLSISRGRSYYNVIDKVIRKHVGSAQIHSRGSGDFEGSLSMLMKDRFDAMIGYPVEIGYFAEKYSINKNDLMMLPVVGSQSYILSYISTPNDDWGKSMMRKINNIIKKSGALKEFNNYYAEWLNDSDKSKFNDTYKKYYKTNYNIDIK